ncbi:hypothetical protein [uncultured Polaribacter sp.]|uniref:hypothetical protein n=1 Tax=uncultured Polaribacter sp. TaxID=174711 RepID=UPI00259BEDE8|nr:hypothetical protein [uncultured Polaribacter sp.]
MSKILHIVSFDIPYPPNYGGIIDVFYKIKELYKLGVKIYLHTYIFDHKTKQVELEKYCEKVTYYKRNNTLISIFSTLPFRLKSRVNKTLNSNLKNLDCPILFEGLHTIYPLYKFNLEKCYVRTHNIEHSYFYGLAKSEKNILKKIFFYLEGFKLKKFERNLKKAKAIFTISPFEQKYFSENFGVNVHYLPAFHETKINSNDYNKGDFILYHGDLRVADNIKSCLFLIDVYKDSSYNLVIATSIKENHIEAEVNKYKNISIKQIPKQQDLNELFSKAHINTLFSFQKTGIKLKLLNTLYKGKFIIANSPLIEDTGLESTCEIANSKEEILKKTETLFQKEFTEKDIEKRLKKLKPFSPETAAKKMMEIIFKQ